MGGWGSGNRTRRRQKMTVEECSQLMVRDFGPGRWRYRRNWGGILDCQPEQFPKLKLSVEFKVLWEGDAACIMLYYTPPGFPYEVVEVPMTSQPMRFGHRRWWFSCPVTNRDGQPCGRCANKLYLPVGRQYFGCRSCHNLTYRSSQEAHKVEREINSRESFWRELDADFADSGIDFMDDMLDVDDWDFFDTDDSYI